MLSTVNKILQRMVTLLIIHQVLWDVDKGIHTRGTVRMATSRINTHHIDMELKTRSLNGFSSLLRERILIPTCQQSYHPRHSTFGLCGNRKPTWVNLLRKDLGKPFLPPPCLKGFWHPKIFVFSCCTWKLIPNSGT